MKFVLFVPTYNVEKEVVPTLDRIPPSVLEKLECVFLIDNGSKDGTRALLRNYIKTHPKFRLFENAENYSLGGSTIIAFRLAREIGADYLICMHSDGQADPALLTQLIAESDGEVDFVFGSRFLPESQTGEYSWIRKAGNLFFIQLQQILLGQKIRDIGAYISFKVKTVTEAPYSQLPSDMGYHPLLILYICRNSSVRFKEIPMSWGRVENSNVNPVIYGLTHLWRLSRFALGWVPLSTRAPQDFKTHEVET